ncbi:hypothetical protein SLAVM298S_07454 [Streptomyces lavendulae subsp. lavendulae]
MAGPGVGLHGVVVPCVHAHGPRAVRVGAVDDHLELCAALLGQEEGGFQGEFLDPAVPHLVPGPERQLDERGSGQQCRTQHHVVGEPGVRGERHPAGQQHALAVGQGDDGTEQGVIGRPETGPGEVTRGGPRLQPVVLALEGVRGQVDASGAASGEDGGPVDGDAVDVEPGQGGGDGHLLGVPVGTQDGDDGGIGVFEDRLGHGGQDTARTDLQEGAHPFPGEGGDRVGETDGLADVAHPVVDGAELLPRHRSAGERRDDRNGRGFEGNTLGYLAEAVEHRVHQRGVEGVRDGEPLRPAAVRREPVDDRRHRIRSARNHHRRGPVDRRDPRAVLEPGQQVPYLLLRGLHGDHHARGRQLLHQPAARRHQGRRVFEREHARHMGGRELAHRVTREQVRPDAPGLHQPEQRHLDREQGGLRVTGLVQQLGIIPEHHVLDRPFEVRCQRGADVVEGLREHREGRVQFTPHARPLAPLSREQEGHRLPGCDDPRHQAAAPGTGRGGVLREPFQCAAQVLTVRCDDRRAVVQGRPGRRRRQAQVGQGLVGVLLRVAQQPCGLAAQGGLVLRGEQYGRRACRVLRRGALSVGRPGLRPRGLLDDDVGVGAAEAERGDRRAPGPVAVFRPLHGLGQEADGRGRPVDVRGRRVHVEGPGQDAVPHRLDHLDDPAHPGRRLGVPDVRLERPQPQRPLGRTPPPVRRQQRLRLDRITQPRPRAVCLHRVDFGGGQAGVRECPADHALLRGAVRGGEAVRGAVLVHGAAADHREHRVPVAAGVGQPLHQQHAQPFAPAGAVGGGREGLAAAVGGQSALAAEVDEGGRGEHGGDAARERQVAFAPPERLHGEVQGDEGGGAGGVDGHGRPFQAEGVRHPSGDDARRAARADVAVDVLHGLLEHRCVVVVHHAREHAGAAALEGGGVDSRPLERLPAGFQQDALLGVHGECLARGYLEEARVEEVDPVEESAFPDVAGAAGVRVGVVEGFEVPAAVGGEFRDGVAAVRQELPQALG